MRPKSSLLNFIKQRKEIASKLGINVGDEYLYMKRIRYVEGEKVMLIENRLNSNLCKRY